MDKQIFLLEKGDKVGLVACSNAIPLQNSRVIHELVEELHALGLESVLSPHLFSKEGPFGGSDQERADDLMALYADDEIKAIFDVSGGDLANGVLDHLDYERIASSWKPFWGYSDLTTVINAIFHKTGKPGCLYQLRNLVWENGIDQLEDFETSVMGEGTGDDLFAPRWTFIQGEEMDGIAVGGNIRCFLKLAGTPYMPDLQDRLLFLEGHSGDVAKMTTYLNWLKQLGAFDRIRGLLLGTFTEMEEERACPDIVELVKRVIGDRSLAIAKTSDVGHYSTSKCLIIGQHARISKDV